MVSLRKIYRASFVANGFFQMSKAHPLASGSHTLVFAIFDKSRFVAEFGRFGIREALLSRGMGIVGPLNIFMDLNALLTNRDIGRMRINPSSAIVIVDAVLTLVHGGMGVAAENSGCREMTGMGERAVGDLLRQALPARAQPVEKTSQGFVFRIPLLQLQVEQRPDQITDADIAYHETVELVTMDGDVAQSLIFPLIFLVHSNPHQMGHNFGQAVVVVSFDPDHFDFTLGIGELANKAEKFPVLFFQASEIKVGKNIAQQNEAAILIFPKNAQCLARAAHVRAEVQIRKDQGVIDLRGHVSIVAQKCYEVINWELIEAPGVICE
jgi:hypothetical protein